MVGFSKSNMKNASHLLVQSKKLKHKHRLWQIVPLIKNPISFEYFHKKYIYDSDLSEYTKVPYPVNSPFKFYKESRPYSASSLSEAVSKWGGNVMELPIPTFKDLMLEHAVAPFFVFQLFCVML